MFNRPLCLPGTAGYAQYAAAAAAAAYGASVAGTGGYYPQAPMSMLGVGHVFAAPVGPVLPTAYYGGGSSSSGGGGASSAAGASSSAAPYKGKTVFDAPPVEESKEDKSKFVRAAGGEIWVDKTMAEWDDNDFRLFCGDLGTDCTDEILARAFSKYPSFLKAKVRGWACVRARFLA